MRVLLSYLTFPGVIAHEFGHVWACRRMRIQVHKVCYLRLGNPMGYVLHEQPDNSLGHIAVAVAPFFVSTVLALSASLLACLLGRSPLDPEMRETAAIVAAWLSFSFALHAFPSSGDSDALMVDVRNSKVGFLAKGLLLPVVGLIRLGRLSARLWLDVVFALIVVALPPMVLLSMAAL